MAMFAKGLGRLMPSLVGGLFKKRCLLQDYQPYLEKVPMLLGKEPMGWHLCVEFLMTLRCEWVQINLV